MTKFFLLFGIALAFLAPQARAEDPPYAVLPSGQYAGEQLDTRNMRTLRAITPEEDAKYRQSPDDVILTDFKHQGKFWTARFPADAVQEAIVQKVVFNRFPAISWLRWFGVKTEEIPMNVHQQMRFKLKPGKEIELFAPPGTDQPLANNKLNDIVFSADALGRDMTRLFQPSLSFRGANVLARQFMSTEDSWAYFASGLRFTIEQTAAPFSEEGKQKALNEAIHRSRDVGYTETFEVLAHNCTTAVRECLTSGAGRKPRIFGGNLLLPLPFWTAWSLQARGIGVGADLRLPTMNEELAHLSEDKELVARGRALARERIAAKRMDMDDAAKGIKPPSALWEACKWSFRKMTRTNK